MSTVLETSPPRERRAIYLTIAAIIAVLLVVALVVHRSGTKTRESEAKADQLISALQAAGLRAPARNTIVRVLGSDGGAVCANPGQALNKASLLAQLTNGAAGPGVRPVIAVSRVVRGETLVIKTYCPDKLADFQKVLDSLDLSEGVVNG